MALPDRSVSVCIPTRGDVDVSGIVQHLRQYREIDDIQIITGTTPFNRYVAAERALQPIIYTQDDDVLTEIQPLLDAFEPGAGVIVNAMTPQHAAQYPGRQTLLGFGSIFDRALLRSLDGWERDALFCREGDRVFAALHPHETVFPEITHLPWASAPNRLWRQPEHVASRKAMEQRIFERTGIRA